MSARAPIVLVGMMATGKTSVGERVADALGARFLDSDTYVESRTGRTVRELFESEGEAAFRVEEAAALAAALAEPGRVVIAAAGGIVLDPVNRERLGQVREGGGHVVWLTAPTDVLAGRVSPDDHRPLLEDDAAATLARLSDEREPLYRDLADIVVDASAPLDEVVATVLDAVAGAPVASSEVAP
jgi:shikimate kinase